MESKHHLTKTCPQCKEIKSIDNFSTFTWCKECIDKQQNTPERIYIRYQRKIKRYGITNKQYEEHLEIQDNSCKICKISFQHTKPEMDHNHRTGKFRGILCHNCNTAIGLFMDYVPNLLQAITYLERNQ